MTEDIFEMSNVTMFKEIEKKQKMGGGGGVLLCYMSSVSELSKPLA